MPGGLLVILIAKSGQGDRTVITVADNEESYWPELVKCLLLVLPSRIRHFWCVPNSEILNLMDSV
jgi:hypothetical protein